MFRRIKDTIYNGSNNIKRWKEKKNGLLRKLIQLRKGLMRDPLCLPTMITLILLQEIEKIDKFASMDIIQKAHVKWDIEGDENSKFFHGLINQKRRNQMINGIMVEGNWITNPCLIKDAFLQFYKRKFQAQDSQTGYLEEIKEAVWDCGSSKAPGPDGYSFAFVKKYWGTIQKDLYDFCGLRQGDPLSPFLFHLVYGRFSIIAFEEACGKNGLINGVNIKNSTIKFPNLFYADDVIIIWVGMLKTWIISLAPESVLQRPGKEFGVVALLFDFGKIFGVGETPFYYGTNSALLSLSLNRIYNGTMVLNWSRYLYLESWSLIGMCLCGDYSWTDSLIDEYLSVVNMDFRGPSLVLLAMPMLKSANHVFFVDLLTFCYRYVEARFLDGVNILFFKLLLGILSMLVISWHAS
ncbi:hypothetical protein Tco_0683998 [Tanacetum coccineum]